MEFTMSKDGSAAETVGRLVPDKFPMGLRVLLVDDDPTCLEILRTKLQHLCKYDVTACAGARDALSLLLAKKGGFDIVLTDFHMPDIDGLQLLESIRSMEMMDHLPVVLFSGEGDEDVVTRGVQKGACDFLLKPIQDETLKMIWQHVLRLKLRKEGAVNSSISEGNQQERSDSAINSLSDDSTANESEGRSRRKRGLASVDQGKEVNDEQGIESDTAAAASKKPRIQWTPDLHQKFLNAIGIIKRRKSPAMRFSNNESEEVQAAPGEILEEMQKMGVKGLKRQQISSHLQKHRTNIKKRTESSEKQNTQDYRICTSSGQYYSPLIKSSSPAQAATYPAAHCHLLARNFPFDDASQQPKKYNSGIDQQLGALPVAPMTEQFILQQNRPIQPPMWNQAPLHSSIATAPANLQFRPPSVFRNQNQLTTVPGLQMVNHSTFTSQTGHHQCIGPGPYVNSNEVPTVSICLQEPAEPPTNINTMAQPISQSFSNSYGTQLYASQQAGIDSHARAATNEYASLNTQDLTASTSLDEDIGLLDLEGLDLSGIDNLDLSWIDNLINSKGWNDTSGTLQGLKPPLN